MACAKFGYELLAAFILVLTGLPNDQRIARAADPVDAEPRRLQRNARHARGHSGRQFNKMTETSGRGIGQSALNNQPPYAMFSLYIAVGKPWKTEHCTGKACRTNSHSGPDSYPADEDTGSAGAWCVLSSIGIYSLTPGYPSYVLSSPVFRKVTLHLPDQKTFTIDSPGNADDTVYVASRTFNGRPYTTTWIHHADRIAGGTLVNSMSNQPNERTVTDDGLTYSASKGKP